LLLHCKIIYLHNFISLHDLEIQYAPITPNTIDGAIV